MLKKPLHTLTLTLALLIAATGASAQTPAAPATKKELVARLLKLQQPGIEALARAMAEQPAAQLLDRADVILPNAVSADRRETVAKEIQADTAKYLNETVPLVTTRAVKLAPTTVGSLLEEKFSEAELLQIVTLLESPVYAKYMQLTGSMQKALQEKLLADTRGTVEPKVKQLEQSISKRLGGPATPASAPAKPAGK
ncbi:hypothetical protein H010_19327 [Hydrogenophaga taeniospiralis CCUG 15921]|uniref:DUF2059 domain-containing protein n=1 Tax=Hydrogenophaga taeniospiralis CCUG 15921 TaxID=1281780 RepID=A0A9X4SGW4_9BURK|nr:hypothetical protein [Hydrogenophaga taeniospiralis]MDG5977416.1 hypothetical protein [Hydrogenophaga taeniospiralis CCUG 15921]